MIFSEKTFRIFLVVGSGAVALIFWVFAIGALAKNLPLKQLGQARICGWEVEEVSDRFALRARYAYDYKGRAYTGTTLFEDAYLNEQSAIAGLKKAAGRSWPLWLNPSCPQSSSLEKNFPVGFLARASIASLVLIYFSFVYVKKYLRS